MCIRDSGQVVAQHAEQVAALRRVVGQQRAELALDVGLQLSLIHI